eukprot:GFUD01000311.1.p1 GENE.GFUD01000311.1~~GFUD01000311.1.p1  ORF type:complete len:223 (-),score=87.90 GFUD01000311.1:105-773(-)
MLISGERLVMVVVGGREKKSDNGGEILEKHSDEKITVETCCIKDLNTAPNLRTAMVETPHRCGRRESGGGKLRVTFSEEELEIHEDEENVENTDKTGEQCARWSKLSRPPYLGWDNPFSPTGSVSQDADIIVRFWKEKRLSRMYCDLLEEEEFNETEEEEFNEDEEEEFNEAGEKVYTAETMENEHKKTKQEKEIVHMIDIKEKIEINSEPEKFQTICCSIS